MKNSKIYLFILTAMIASMTACTLTKRHYAPGYHVEWKHFSKQAHVPASQSNQKMDEPVANHVEMSAATNVLTASENNCVTKIADDQSASFAPFNAVAAPVKMKLNTRAVAKMALKNHLAASSMNHEAASVLAQSNSTSPDALSWLIWVAAILLIPIIGGPLYILVWTATKNGKVDWKPVLLSLLCYLLCWFPGVIYDIVWIKKNCSGSLF